MNFSHLDLEWCFAQSVCRCTEPLSNGASGRGPLYTLCRAILGRNSLLVSLSLNLSSACKRFSKPKRELHTKQTVKLGDMNFICVAQTAEASYYWCRSVVLMCPWCTLLPLRLFPGHLRKKRRPNNRQTGVNTSVLWKWFTWKSCRALLALCRAQPGTFPPFSFPRIHTAKKKLSRSDEENSVFLTETLHQIFFLISFFSFLWYKRLRTLEDGNQEHCAFYWENFRSEFWAFEFNSSQLPHAAFLLPTRRAA